MKEPFLEMLRGNTNTLGRAVEVVDLIIEEPSRMQEVYDLFFQDDEWVKLRAGNVFKRLWRSRPELVAPFIDGWVDDVSKLNQPSVNWNFAQLMDERIEDVTPKQKKIAVKRIQGYLNTSDDWIVQNTSIQTLGTWARDDETLRKWLLPQLEKFSRSDKSSVARRAEKFLDKLS